MMRKTLVLLFFASILVVSTLSQSQPQRRRRRMLALDIQEEEEIPKKKTNLISKNQTKIIKPFNTNSTKSTKSLSNTTTLKKLNSTSSKSSNSTKLINNSIPTKKSLDLSKPIIPKNKTQIIEKKPKSQNTLETKNQIQSLPIPKPKLQKTQKPIKPLWMGIDGDDDNDDLVTELSEFRDLPSKFQKQLIPDLERISITSKAYINQANREISEGFRPLVGKQYAPTIASTISCLFLFLPLLIVSLIFHKIKAYFSLQKILIFIQVYLSIYFSILSFASLVTGLEPLKFFYASSQSSYICLQVLQTLAYVLYLLLLVMYFILVFSTDTGLGLKALGLVQTIVGFAVGLHYYVSVFHRAVLHQPPKTNWKIHGIYATCFLVICLFANAERRKKEYLEDGGEEGKKS
ncbi:hypothetical protein AQUCO_01000235v1 [Aquilegia coerulea]|uniref:Uncharacterized protein n=1 Tax=Aquilegia coerulea TaxID=218851 RepID=A0A2G5E8X1_AQUCA|nr:hypothetical protein AQUCO_01000235v1 [Aquilegia coerulea]